MYEALSYRLDQEMSGDAEIFQSSHNLPLGVEGGHALRGGKGGGVGGRGPGWGSQDRHPAGPGPSGCPPPRACRVIYPENRTVVRASEK